MKLKRVYIGFVFFILVIILLVTCKDEFTKTLNASKNAKAEKRVK